MPDPASETTTDLLEAITQYGLGRIKRHIFLCADQTEPKCAPRERTLVAWEFLKRRLAELGLTAGERVVYRTKANCLRMCAQGPIAVVYPRAPGTTRAIRRCSSASSRST